MLWWLIENSLVAGLIAVPVWLACRVRRISPATRHALWLIVLVKLVTPPLVTWPWRLPSPLQWPWTYSADAIGNQPSPAARAFSDDYLEGDDGPGQPEKLAASEPMPQFSTPLNALAITSGGIAQFDATDSYARAIDEAEAGHCEVARELQPAYLAATSRGDWLATVMVESGPFAVWLWLLGGALSAVVQAIQIGQFLRVLRKARPGPPALVERVQRAAGILRVRPVGVAVLSQIRSPVIWGGWRPRLVWPETLATDFESGRWDGVIAHELAHLRRGDHWIGWIELLAGCMYWWNPLYWYVRHQLRENAELACDALVVWALPDGRRSYAESLIEVVSHSSRASLPVPVLGVHSVARQAFERRLTMILSERFPSKLSIGALVAISVLGLAALPGWSHAQSQSAPAKAQLPPSTAVRAGPSLVPAAEDPDFSIELFSAPSQPLQAIADPPLAVLPLDGASAAQSAGEPASDDARIETLEKKLQALIDEVKAMRTSRSALPRAVPTLNQLAVTRVAADELTSNVQTLSRAQYRLPQAKAEALAAFLREHMKSPVEAKVDGDALIVTAAPQVQAAIGQFIALSEGLDSDPRAEWQLQQYPNRRFIYHGSSPVKARVSSEPAKAAPATTTAPNRQ